MKSLYKNLDRLSKCKNRKHNRFLIFNKLKTQETNKKDYILNIKDKKNLKVDISK